MTDVKDRLFPAAALFVKRLFAEFQRDQCLTRAASLAFASLLALVPLSALLFSLFSALGSFSDVVANIQAFLFTQLVPTSQEEIMPYIQRFVENTRALGVVGLLFFLITAVFLLNTIQSTFNAVWGSRTQKNSLRRLATYASVLIVGSFLFSIGLNLTGMLGSLVGGSTVEEIGRTLAFLTGVLPSIFIFVALLVMILFIPSGRVHVESALIGAAVGALLWEAARRIFFFWITYVIRLSIVYGSLAVIPIFLIWLYVAWTIVLLSLEIAFVHQHRKLAWLGKRLGQISPAERFLFGLEVFFHVAGRFFRGEPPPSRSLLARHFSVSPADISHVIDQFRQDNLLLSAGEENALLTPARSLDKISLQELFRSLLGDPADAPWRSEEALALFQAVTGAAVRSLGKTTVLEFLKTAGGQYPAASTPAGKAGMASGRRGAGNLAALKRWLWSRIGRADRGV
jgi:membrane protein